jgi:hypothetical protein
MAMAYTDTDTDIYGGYLRGRADSLLVGKEACGMEAAPQIERTGLPDASQLGIGTHHSSLTTTLNSHLLMS